MPKLPANNPCEGCHGSCCDPITGGIGLFFPLEASHPRQVADASLVDRAYRHVQRELERIVSEISPHVLEPNRFRLQGNSFDLSPDSHLVSAQLPSSAIPVVMIRSQLAIICNCLAFDRKHGTCMAYDLRPRMCRELQVSPDCLPVRSRTSAQKN